jgi:hypothetical protein
MPPEGMVHALEMVSDLLKPGGRLIDIHPSGQPPPIELLCGANRILLGYLQETDNFIEYAQANAALAQAVDNGWFSLESQAYFTSCTWADSVAELWEFLAQTWSDAVLPDETAARSAEKQAGLVNPEAQNAVVITEAIRITRLARQQ